MTQKKFDVYEFDPNKTYIVSVKTNKPAEEKLQILTNVVEALQEKGHYNNIILVDGDTITVEEATEFLDNDDQFKFRTKYEALLNAVKWRHEDYKRDLDRGCDSDGEPLEKTNLMIIQNLYNVTEAILSSVGESDYDKDKTN